MRDARGGVVGSTVQGRALTADRYFQTHPSAAGKRYDGLALAGPDLGPASQALADRVKGDVAKRCGEGVAGPTLGFLGDPHVNVLALNQALDALGRSAPPR